MSNSRSLYAVLFLVFAGLVLFLPARWTGSFRTLLAGLIAPVTRATRTVLGLGTPAPDAEPAASDRALLAGLRTENAELRAALLRAQAEAFELRRKSEALRQLAEGGFREVPVITPANIVTRRDASNWHRSLLLDRGAADGIQPGQPVVWGRCVLGRIVETAPASCRVRLLTDPAFRMKVLLVPEAPAGTQVAPVSGLLQGTGQEDCEVVWVLRDNPVRAGWGVVTLEDDGGAWPKGLSVGRVREVSDDFGSYLRIQVRPELDPTTLDSVFVLKVH